MDIFEESVLRLKQQLKVTGDKDVAEVLGISASAFNMRKKRRSFPEKELRSLAERRPGLEIDVDYVLTGRSAAAIKADAASIGGRIRQVRGKRSATAFSASLGISSEELDAIERNAAPPASDFVQRLIEAYPEVDMLWLLADDPTPPPEDLNHLESILIYNYRASSAEGKAILRQLAASCAAWNKSNPA